MYSEIHSDDSGVAVLGNSELVEEEEEDIEGRSSQHVEAMKVDEGANNSVEEITLDTESEVESVPPKQSHVEVSNACREKIETICLALLILEKEDSHKEAKTKCPLLPCTKLYSKTSITIGRSYQTLPQGH